MADRFWVPGGTGNTNSTTNWSDTSGGSSGFSVPTSADNAIFDGGSGTGFTATINASFNCLNFDTSAANAFTLAGSSFFTIFGSLTLHAGLTRTFTGIVTFAATATGKTVTMAGNTWASASVSFNGSGGGWTLQDSFTTTAALNLPLGALNTNGVAVSCGPFDFSGSSARTLTLGNSTVTCTSWFVNPATGLTFNANTSTIVVAPTATTSTCTFGNFTYNNVTFQNSGNYTDIVLGGSTMTVSGALIGTGANANTQRIRLRPSTTGTKVNTTCNGTVTLSNVDFMDTGFLGTAAPVSGTSIGDCGNNTGITFTPAVTRFYVGNGGNLVDTAQMSATSGGATGATVPLPQDTLVFDANSITSGSQTVTNNVSGYRIGTLSLSAIANAPTLTFTNALSVFGSCHFGPVTFTNSSALSILGRGSNTLGGTVTDWGSGFALTIGTFGGTVTLDDHLGTFSEGANLPAITYTSGTWTGSTFDVAYSTLTSSGSTTRVLNLGSGTWRGNATGSQWNMSGTTGLTINAQSSTIEMYGATASTKTFVGGGKTYAILKFKGTGSGSHDLTGSNTFTQLVYAETLGAHSIRFTAGTTTAIFSLGWKINGSAANQVTVSSITASTHTLFFMGSGKANSNYITPTNSIVSGSTPAYAGINGANGTGNTNWIFGRQAGPNSQQITMGN